MQEILFLEDIFNVMIALEDLGNQHYCEMQLLTSNSELKQLFKKLATQELDHKQLYMKYKSMNITSDLSKMDDQYHSYLKALLAGTISFLNDSREIKDFNHGFDIAINLEKDTILLLSELKGVIDSNNYGAIDSIIVQEREHLTSLLSQIGDN